MTNAYDLDGMTVEQLDELVHELKGQEAADINNAGREAQINYIKGGTE